MHPMFIYSSNVPHLCLYVVLPNTYVLRIHCMLCTLGLSPPPPRTTQVGWA